MKMKGKKRRFGDEERVREGRNGWVFCVKWKGTKVISIAAF
jgi:predicted Ser/Thr protein kinase